MIWPNESEMGRIQIELSNYCNAACPACERAYVIDEKPIDPEFKLNNKFITLKEIKKTFIPGRWDSLDLIHFCGNVDEPVINPDILDITKYFYDLPTKGPRLFIATNGGTRDEKFWSKLGHLSYERSNDGKYSGVFAVWGIDGLEDTNDIYRINVDWNTLEKNWKAYIKAGGEAFWQFLVFPWNKHQIKEAETRALNEGFTKFLVKQSYHRDARIEFEYEPRVNFGEVIK